MSRDTTGRVVLGIDVGTSNTKAALVTLRDDGSVDASALAATPTPDDVPGLLAAVRHVATEVLERSDARPEAIGVASMAETGVPLDPQGVPMTGLLRWDGHRAREQAAALATVHGADELFAATGVRPGAKVPLAVWAWLRSEGVVMHRWAGAADVVVLALTGRLATDHTLAGRTGAYRITDGGAAVPGTFDAELLGLVGLRPEQLPDVVAPDASAGVVDAGAAGAAGLGDLVARGAGAGLVAGTPVVVAGHDHAVGTWAAGVRAPGGRADSVGTAEAVLTVLAGPPVPAPVAAAGMSWVRTVSGRDHALLAGSSSAGAMLHWLEGRLDGLTLDEALRAAWADLAAHPEPTGVLVLPHLSGRQTPAPDPDARVQVLGEDVGDPVRLTRAVLEGVCLQARWMLAEQAALGAVHPGPLTVLGGPALAVPAWAETKRRVMPEPLVWVTSAEPVAVGAAVLAAVRSGLLGDPATVLADGPSLATAAPDRDLRETNDAYDVQLTRFVAAATAPPPGAPPADVPATT